MSALSIQPTFPIFTDIDGQPLEDGYVWIGTANLDPQTNPISVFFDAALTIPAPQPIRTLSGYPARTGSPGRLYVNSDYSIRVMNKNGTVVYSAPVATERYSGAVISTINASQVIYDPAGSGAVATTAQTKLRETVSVKDFGAVGDGVADDTSKIQAAINAVNAAGGGSVFIPAGTYKVGRVNPISNVDIYGEGASSVLTTTLSSLGALTMSDQVNINISYLKIQGNNLQDITNPQDGDTGIYINQSENIKIHHCVIDGTWAWGIVTVGPNTRDIDISHNTILNVGNQSGISFAGGSQNCIASHNIIKNVKLYGLEVESSSGNAPPRCRRIVLDGNYVENCVAGVGLAFAVDEIIVTNNHFNDNNNVNTISSASGLGVFVVGDLVLNTRRPERLIITNNIIRNHKNIPVLFSGLVNEVNFSNNIIIKGADVSGSRRIILTANAAQLDFKFIGNSIDCSNAGYPAFDLAGIDSLILKDNAVFNVPDTHFIIEIASNVTNATIEMPKVRAGEIPLLTGVDVTQGGGTNYSYSYEFPEYTILSGSTTNRYLTCRRNLKIVGVQFCVSPASIGGGATDYWVVNIDGSDIAPNHVATVADRDNWFYTPLNIQKAAGSEIDFRILNGLGVAFNHQRFRLIVI